MNAVVTCTFGEKYNSIAKVTHAFLQEYAKRIGADFIVINEKKLSKKFVQYEKFQLRGLFAKYNRIIYIDTDIIVRNDCPSLFDIVPEDKVGIFNEGAFTSCMELIRDACVKFGKSLKLGMIQYKGQYYNTGVMVLSRKHKDIFTVPEEEYDWYNAGVNSVSHYEQPYINLKIIAGTYEVHELSYKYNRMFMLDNLTGENKLASYMVHYAGLNHRDDIVDIISKDAETWRASSDFKYQRKLYVSVGGGLGDQVDAEPVIRYAMETLYPGDEFIIRTDFPEIFDHLSAKVVAKAGDLNGYFRMETLPAPESLLWQHIAQTMCHTTDFASISALRRVLSNKDKQIKLVVTDEEVEDLKKTIGIEDLKSLVLIHPGRGWASKTFPSEYWSEIIKGVSANNKVAVIGKSISKEQGLVDVSCEGVIDLRNLLNLRELITLISQAKLLISNDSAPVHIAGAFDNWIFLIPSCKHPDHILPYREGGQYHKAKTFYKRLTCDDIDSSPTNIDGQTIDYLAKDIKNYLEYPEVLIQAIKEAL
jgi:hypothetical protein